MEAIIFVVAFLLIIFQHAQVSNILKKFSRIKSNTIYCKTETDAQSKASVCPNPSKRRRTEPMVLSLKQPESRGSSKSQLGWILSGKPKPNNVIEENKQYAENLLSITPLQFAKWEKERKLREKDLGKSPKSLSTLSHMAVKKQYSDEAFRSNITALIENLQCNKMSLEGKYLENKASKMTESLLCTLENLITTSSIENPLPFKGDITTLAVDAAELLQLNNATEKRATPEHLTISTRSSSKTVNWADTNSISDML